MTRDALGTEYADYNLVVAGPLGMPTEQSTINGALKQLIEENDLPKVVFHSFRHSSYSHKNTIRPFFLQDNAHFHSHCYIDQSFLAESSGLFLLKTFVHHTSYGCMVWFTNAKQANIRRETYTSQLMKGGHFTMNLPLFISSANFLLMKSLLLVLFRGLCSLLRLTAQQKIN